jgi:hypothetical protein
MPVAREGVISIPSAAIVLDFFNLEEGPGGGGHFFLFLDGFWFGLGQKRFQNQKK